MSNLRCSLFVKTKEKKRKGSDMANASRTTCYLPGIARSSTFMLVFSVLCFVGCVSGSCLSYGHSCWGAHGKRSSFRGNSDFQLILPNDETVRKDSSATAKEQWILSRLAVKRPSSSANEKYRVRWNDFYETKTFLPRQWNIDEEPTNGINNDRLREHSNDDGEREEEAKKLKDIREMDESSEILVIPQTATEKQIHRPIKIHFFKILSDDGKSAK